ncbi:hypothetical protein ACFL3H_05710, partial [Gemmatimonadota bacterium]
RRRGTEAGEREEVSNTRAYSLQVDTFAEAVEKGGEFAIPGIEGLRNQMVLDALLRSRASGRIEHVEQI